MSRRGPGTGIRHRSVRLAMVVAAATLIATAKGVAQTPSTAPFSSAGTPRAAGPSPSTSPAASTHASPAAPSGVTHELLGTTEPEDGTVGRIEMLRTMLAPGAKMPPTRFAGNWLVRVESGALTATLVDGAAGIEGATGADDDPIAQQSTRILGAERVLWSGPDAVLTWENRGSEPVIVLSTAVTRGEDAVMMAVDPSARPGSAFRDRVVKRIVLTGPGSTGDRYRIAVADRSGQVIGARVPTERELRFASGGEPARDYRDIGIGPVAYLEGNVRELLIRWTGTPCGPVVTVDVAKELSALRVRDKTPGCDAAGVGYTGVLRLRGRVPSLVDIDGSWVRRR